MKGLFRWFKSLLVNNKQIENEEDYDTKDAMPAHLNLTKTEELFLQTLNDLSTIINSEDAYKVLMSSALIRKLYLDDLPLVHQINKKYKLKVQYEIGKMELSSLKIDEKLSICSVLSGIEPDINGNNKRYVSLNTFLNSVIGVVKGEQYTVKDIIKHLANTMGGIHASSPEVIQKQKISILNEFYVNELNIPLIQIKSIAKVILRALKPLKEKILKYEDFEGAEGVGFHMLLIPLQLRDKNNFLVDFGVRENRNRFFAYINSGNQICFRFYDSEGNYYAVDGGAAGHTFKYGQPLYMGFEIINMNDKILLKIDLGTWSYLRAYTGKMTFPKDIYCVLGSDFKGKEHTNMSMYGYYIYYPKTCSDRAALNEYLDYKLANGFKKTIRFKGNKFLYVNDHPLFSKNKKKR